MTEQITIKLNRFKFVKLIDELMEFTEFFIDKQSGVTAFFIWMHQVITHTPQNGDATYCDMMSDMLQISKEKMILERISGYKKFMKQKVTGDGEKQYTFKLNRKKFGPILEDLNTYYHDVFETYSELAGFCIWSGHRMIHHTLKLPDGSEKTPFQLFSEAAGRSKEEMILHDMGEFKRFSRTRGI